MVAIGIDLDNKFQSSDQIIELLNGEIEKWRKNLVLCNAIALMNYYLMQIPQLMIRTLPRL